MSLYDFPCEYCEGMVRERTLDREPISHHRGIVVLENVPIGVCEHCGAHYYAAAVLKRVEAILTSTTPASRTLQVPVEVY
ncbi:MAG: YgiT-type zinc finger protein [Planctomycetes bacterium]|nr:YgiT-type zinc finger protein [Planctomycetota bacterium]